MPDRVELTTVAAVASKVPKAAMPPPPSQAPAVLLLTRQPVTFAEPPVMARPPPENIAELPETVESMMLEVLRNRVRPPPSPLAALLPEMTD